MSFDDFLDDIPSQSLHLRNNTDESLKLWMELWLEEVKSKKKSEKTLKSYRDGILKFLNFISMHPIMIEKISSRLINRYLMQYQYDLACAKRGKITDDKIKLLKDELKTPNLGKNDSGFTILYAFQNTLLLRTTTLKMFLKFITENNEEQHDYTALFKHIATIKIDEKFTEYLTQKEIISVVNYMQNWLIDYAKIKPRSHERYAYRDAFLMTLYALTGARSFEMTNVRLSDIKEGKIDNTKGYIISIRRAKGGKIRKVFVVKKSVEHYLSYFRDAFKGKDYYISSTFANGAYTDKPMAERTIRGFSNQILIALGINKSGLHIFRRGYVTKRINHDKVDVSIVAKEVGNTVAILEKHYLKQNLGE